MSDSVIWKPQPGSQELFLDCPIFETLYTGNRGPGKTDALLMDYGQDVGKGYGRDWRGIIFRETYPQLGDLISKTQKWFPQIWPDAKYNESKSFWHWPDGEVLLLRHFAKEKDYWNYHGHAYPFVGWEEICNWRDPVGYKRMMSCCRSTNKDMPRKYRATANPYGPGHSWVKHRFKLPGHMFVVIKGEKDENGFIEPNRIAINGSIRENKILLEADPGYIDRIAAAARNPQELKAWIEGDWDIISGGIFGDVWQDKYNKVTPFDIPFGWLKTRSFDWGSARPFSVGWWTESDGSDVQLKNGEWISTVRGDQFRFHEWYGWNGEPNTGLQMLAIDVSKGIIERELAWNLYGHIDPGPADSSIYNVENGSCIVTDMSQEVRINGEWYEGVEWRRADKRPGSRITGWEMVRKMMKAAWPNKDGRPREEPGLFVFSNCDQFFRTVPTLPRDDRKIEDVDTDTEDHAGDETRYHITGIGNAVSHGTTSGMY